MAIVLGMVNMHRCVEIERLESKLRKRLMIAYVPYVERKRRPLKNVVGSFRMAARKKFWNSQVCIKMRTSKMRVFSKRTINMV